MKQNKVLDVCKEILAYVVERGFTLQIHRRELEKAIMVFRGADKRTIQTWIRVLETFEYIKPINPFIYELNLRAFPELLNKVIQNGQKKLL